jgi:hypothetical protein
MQLNLTEPKHYAAQELGFPIQEKLHETVIEPNHIPGTFWGSRVSRIHTLRRNRS